MSRKPLLFLLLAMVLGCWLSQTKPLAAQAPLETPPGKGQARGKVPLKQPEAPISARIVVFHGAVQAMPEDGLIGTWQVGEQQVEVTAATRIQGTPAVGLFVMVQGNRNPDGSIQARQIKVKRDRGERREMVQVRGVVSAYSAEAITINGVTAAITTTTVIHGTPVVGGRAKVQALVQPDGGLLALRIHALGEDEEQEIEFTAPIVALNGDTWTVGALTVIIRTSTQIQGTPAVGAMAEVEGTLNADGTVLARRVKIEVEDEDEQDDLAAFRGTILALPEESLGTWRLSTRQGEISVVVDEATFLDESRGLLVVGATAQVKAVREDDGTLRATRIRAHR